MENLKNKTILILITGGAGFIGSHISEKMLNLGFKVRILDNLSSGKLENIEHLLGNNRLNFIEADISNFEICNKACENVDIICHHAALSSVPASMDNPLLNNQYNVTGTLNLLEAAKKNNIKRFIFASSSAVYGENDLPFIENNIGKIRSPYGLSKYMDELYCKLYTEIYDMECIGLRYFNVYGPRQNPKGNYACVIPKFITILDNGYSPVIFGDGSFSRDFIYISDVVEANYLAMTTTNKATFGNIYNIGSGESITIKELYMIIKELMNSDKYPIYKDFRLGDVPHTLADINKAHHDLNFSPNIDITRGLLDTINYFRKKLKIEN